MNLILVAVLSSNVLAANSRDKAVQEPEKNVIVQSTGKSNQRVKTIRVPVVIKNVERNNGGVKK
jgi:hypothetical protein